MHICIGKDRGLLALAAGLGIINAAGSAFISIGLQKILDVAVARDLDGFWRLLTIILIYVGVLCILSFLEVLCGKVLLRNITESMRSRIFCGVIQKRPEAYYKNNTADYLSSIMNDVKLVEEQYLKPLLLCCQMAALFLTTLGILCYLSPVVTAILAGFLMLMFLVPALLGKALEKRQEAYSEKLAAFTAVSKDFLGGFEVVRSFSVSSHIKKSFQEQNRAAADAKLRADRLIAVNESLAEMLSVISTVVVVFVSAYMVLRGSITVGTLLALIQLSGTFSTPVLVLLQSYPQMKGMKPIIKKLGELSQDQGDWEQEESRKGQEGRDCAEFKKALELKDVSFAYEQDKDILDKKSLVIEPGKKYALLGDSGCGKTTMIKLLTGYSANYRGSITYDSREVRNMERWEFSRLVSVIHQNVYLFDTDIYHNICLGEEFSQQELALALDKSGVSQFLGSLEQGIYTKVGENGGRLSGGQRQRVALARAIIRKTPLLILDEGTSAVDQKTAYAIEKQLLEEDGLALITITHHMQQDLEELYDQIIRLEPNQIETETMPLKVS